MFDHIDVYVLLRTNVNSETEIETSLLSKEYYYQKIFL